MDDLHETPQTPDREKFAPEWEDDASSATEKPKQKGQTLLSWCFIILFVIGIVVLQTLKRGEEEPADASSNPGQASPILQMQARYAVGAVNSLPVGEEREALLKQLSSMRQGSWQERFSYVVLVGELLGPAKALEEINHALTTQHEPLDIESKEVELFYALQKLYKDYNRLNWQSSLSESQRTLIREELGWFGELALAPQPTSEPGKEFPATVGGPVSVVYADTRYPPPGDREQALQPAYRTFMTIFGAGVGVVVLGGLGFIGLVVLGSLALAGVVKGGLKTGSGVGGIYAETFAIWLPVFLGLNMAAQAWAPSKYVLLCSGAAFFLSLVVLFWPSLRGVSARTMLGEIGLTANGKPLREILWGFACYLMTLPFMILGFVLILLFVFLQQRIQQMWSGEEGDGGASSLQGASHPIVDHLANVEWGLVLQIFLVASIAAPIVEEIMFRGVLYRHLRELTGRWGFALSAVVSALVASFIFAVIHPQGFLAIPALMALAFGFNIAREWRNSVIPAMIAHGLNNGLVLMVVILAMN